MAIKLPKFNFINQLDARARIFFLLAIVVAIILLVYAGTRFFFGGESAIGTSRVANAPAGLQSVPGSPNLSAEYQQSLQQANEQAAQQAQITGTGAIPTQINTGVLATNACVICTDQDVNVKSLLDRWQSQGQITPDTAAMLQQLADKNVSPEEYAAALDRLVKEGKLTPEQARQLLDQYRKQHANGLVNESAKVMDGMIKAGVLPIDVANRLLNAQRAGMSPANYAGLLQDQVAQGRLSPGAAQQLLAQYTQQRAREVTMRSIAALRQMAASGQMTPEVEAQLIDLENRMVPLNVYATTLQQLTSQGKLVPAVADKILAEYQGQKAETGPAASVNQMLQKAEAAAYGEINDLMRAGKMSPEVGAELTRLIQSNVPLNDYRTVINQLVQQGKLTPEIAKLKLADYQAVKSLRELAQTLGNLQANNVPPSVYANALRDAVKNGTLTPEQAAQLMQEYQAALNQALAPTGTAPANTEAFAELQRRAAETAVNAGPTATPAEFAAAQTQAAQVSTADKQAQIDALAQSMAGQAQQLISAWEPATMAHREGTPETKNAGGTQGAGRGFGGGGAGSLGTSGAINAPLIKAGTIYFAVLDTTVNSDYPDSPVLATIVSGPFKGSKLLGKMVLTKGVAGQQDRVSLNFTLMNKNEWPTSRNITAYGIDPDDAKTALATSVDYHYLKRFGAVMATSFLQGYAGAITNAGTSTTGIFGTSTTHPELSPSSKLLVGLGQVGQTLGSTTQQWVNIPPTVKVDSGVGLGILFMSDVT